MKVDGIPDTIDRAKFDDPVSVMLGIRKYVVADLSNFAGFDSNLRALDSVHKEPEKVENSVFDVLDAVIDGQNPKPPFNLGYSVATSPDRLAPRAGGHGTSLCCFGPRRHQDDSERAGANRGGCKGYRRIAA